MSLKAREILGSKSQMTRTSSGLVKAILLIQRRCRRWILLWKALLRLINAIQAPIGRIRLHIGRVDGIQRHQDILCVNAMATTGVC
jgi:hypothetical protein